MLNQMDNKFKLDLKMKFKLNLMVKFLIILKVNCKLKLS
jgi:hypothetical protein